MGENCSHHYDSGEGAVEIFGWAYKALKPTKPIGVTLDKQGRGYCKLCGKLTQSNIPLEECTWYRKIQGEMFLIREFTVCKREDSVNSIINCETFIAKMYNDYSFEVNEKPYTIVDFNETFSAKIP